MNSLFGVSSALCFVRQGFTKLRQLKNVHHSSQYVRQNCSCSFRYCQCHSLLTPNPNLLNTSASTFATIRKQSTIASQNDINSNSSNQKNIASNKNDDNSNQVLVEPGTVLFHNRDKWPRDLLEKSEKDVGLSFDFISEEEEGVLLNEVQVPLKRLRYEEEHWDDAIYLYRETEKTKWSDEAMKILGKVRTHAFPPHTRHLAHIHILDLHQDGHIKPHIDAVRYCGNVIAGLSLLSDSVMRLVHKDNKDLFLDMLLKRRSLYILRGVLRYDFTHEVLSEAESYFDSLKVPRDKRISIMCRDTPHKEQQNQVDAGISWKEFPDKTAS